MNSLKIFILFSVIGFTPSFAQQKVIDLPIEVDTIFQGIKTKIILNEVRMYPRESFADMVIGFYNPDIKQWIFFEGTNIPFSKNGFSGSFLLKLIKKVNEEVPNLKFLDPILKRDDEVNFRWWCECEILKNILL